MRRSITRLTFWSACMALGLALLADAQEPKVDYETQIQPIFTTNCAVSGCHTGETLPFGGFAGAGMILSAGKSYDQLVGVPSKLDSSRFSRVVAAASAASLITLKLEGAEGVGSRMPLGGEPLPAASIKLIKDWIDQGALSERPTAVEKMTWGKIKEQDPGQE